MIAEIREPHTCMSQTPLHQGIHSLPVNSEPAMTTSDSSPTMASRNAASLSVESSPERIRGDLPVPTCGQPQRRLRLALQLDPLRVRDIEPCLVQTNIRADLPRQQRMFFRRVATDQQNRRRVRNVAQAGGRFLMSSQRARKPRIVRGPLVIDIVRLQNCARKLLQQIILFVCAWCSSR